MLSSMPNEGTNELRSADSDWAPFRTGENSASLIPISAARRTDVTGDSSLRQVFAETAKSVIQWPELKLKLILA